MDCGHVVLPTHSSMKRHRSGSVRGDGSPLSGSGPRRMRLTSTACSPSLSRSGGCPLRRVSARAVDQPEQPFGIEPLHRIAQRLVLDPGRVGRLGASIPVHRGHWRSTTCVAPCVPVAFLATVEARSPSQHPRGSQDPGHRNSSASLREESIHDGQRKPRRVTPSARRHDCLNQLEWVEKARPMPDRASVFTWLPRARVDPSGPGRCRRQAETPLIRPVQVL